MGQCKKHNITSKASCKYRERGGEPGGETETEGLIYEKINLLYGGDYEEASVEESPSAGETPAIEEVMEGTTPVAEEARADTPPAVRLSSEVLLHSAPPFYLHLPEDDEELKETIV